MSEAILGHFDLNEVRDNKAIRNTILELQRQQREKRDFAIHSPSLAVAETGEIIIREMPKFFKVNGQTIMNWESAERLADEESKRTGTHVKVEPIEAGEANLPLSRTAEQQLCNRIGLPIRYVDSLRDRTYGSEKEKKTFADLAAQNFNTLLARGDEKFLVRTLDGSVRAMLSDAYRSLDNADLFFAAAEEIEKVGADIWSMRLSDDRFDMLCVAPNIYADVQTDRTFDPGDGWISRWYNGNATDTHFAALRISNSETGKGKLTVNMAILRRVCMNFCVWGTGVANVHIGRRINREGEIMASEETRYYDNRAIWSSVRDTIKTAFNADKFTAYINKLNDATQVAIEKPKEVVEKVAGALDISDLVKDRIFKKFCEDQDYSKYGLVQAITWQAHELVKAGDIEEADRMEEIGGSMIEGKKFDSLLKV